MGFFIFGKAHTGSLYGFLPSADIEQVVYGAWAFKHWARHFPHSQQHEHSTQNRRLNVKDV